LPDYEIAPDGSFREWLWPGILENNRHRHASHLYALYDECPPEIVNNSKLVNAVAHTVQERLKFREENSKGTMAFGVVQLGLASAHTGNAEQAQQCINILAKGYWADGMASFHNWGALFNMDISGGFPYLCASALVYAEHGRIRFFPARPPQWQSGSIRGLRLRGGIVLRELTWQGAASHATLLAHSDQVVTVEANGSRPRRIELRRGVAMDITL
jgi:alpha-L-fucosidase 2